MKRRQGKSNTSAICMEKHFTQHNNHHYHHLLLYNDHPLGDV